MKGTKLSLRGLTFVGLLGFFCRLVDARVNGQRKLENELNEPTGIYWDLSCPWEMNHFSIARSNAHFFDDPEYMTRPGSDTREVFRNNARAARDFSLSHQTPQRFNENVSNLIGRRTVILGDSLSRQTFISMGCLLPKHMVHSQATGWKLNLEHAMEFYDARIKLQPSGEIIYAPKAGAVLDFNWSGEWSPITSDDNWLRACSERQPFQFKTKYIPPRTEPSSDNTEYHEGDIIHETVRLDRNDVVIFNAGLHQTRPENLENIEKLLDCMDKAKQEDPSSLDWPHITYSKTSLQHFDTPDGGWAGKPTLTCGDTNYEVYNQMEDLKLFENRVPVIGLALNYTELGFLHVKGLIPDCTHWFQPGLPDLVAVDALESMSRLNGMSFG